MQIKMWSLLYSRYERNNSWLAAEKSQYDARLTVKTQGRCEQYSIGYTKQQYQSFPAWGYVLVGLNVGVWEPVLVYRKNEIVLLVVNEQHLRLHLFWRFIWYILLN